MFTDVSVIRLGEQFSYEVDDDLNSGAVTLSYGGKSLTPSVSSSTQGTATAPEGLEYGFRHDLVLSIDGTEVARYKALFFPPTGKDFETLLVDHATISAESDLKALTDLDYEDQIEFDEGIELDPSSGIFSDPTGLIASFEYRVIDRSDDYDRGPAAIITLSDAPEEQTTLRVVQAPRVLTLGSASFSIPSSKAAAGDFALLIANSIGAKSTALVGWDKWCESTSSGSEPTNITVYSKELGAGDLDTDFTLSNSGSARTSYTVLVVSGVEDAEPFISDFTGAYVRTQTGTFDCNPYGLSVDAYDSVVFNVFAASHDTGILKNKTPSPGYAAVTEMQSMHGEPYLFVQEKTGVAVGTENANIAVMEGPERASDMLALQSITVGLRTKSSGTIITIPPDDLTIYVATGASVDSSNSDIVEWLTGGNYDSSNIETVTLAAGPNEITFSRDGSDDATATLTIVEVAIPVINLPSEPVTVTENQPILLAFTIDNFSGQPTAAVGEVLDIGDGDYDLYIADGLDTEAGATQVIAVFADDGINPQQSSTVTFSVGNELEAEVIVPPSTTIALQQGESPSASHPSVIAWLARADADSNNIESLTLTMGDNIVTFSKADAADKNSILKFVNAVTSPLRKSRPTYGGKGANT